MTSLKTKRLTMLAKKVLKDNGFELKFESAEFLQFSGIGYLDILLAQRPISREMLKNATIIPHINIKCLLPEDIIGLKIQAYTNDSSREFQDKADIQFLIENYQNMNWDKIKSYADLFSKWSEIEIIKNKINSFNLNRESQRRFLIPISSFNLLA